MTLRTGTIVLALLAATSGFCEDAPNSVLKTEATDGLPDEAKPIAAPIIKPRPDDSKLADSIDDGAEGG